MAAHSNGQAIIFLPCGFFYLILLAIFFSSPNLSRRRLDVCHTSTHGVALVRIYDAGLKFAARDSLEMQDLKIAKNSPSEHHRTTLFATKPRIDSWKKRAECLSHMSSQYGELRPTSG